MNTENAGSEFEMKKCNLILVFSPDRSKILMCLRKKAPHQGKLNFVGGKIEPGEMSEEAAYRELFEETAISRDDIKISHLMDLTYCEEELLLEFWSGTLIHEKNVFGNENRLMWISSDDDFSDNSRFAGTGNIYCMVNYARLMASGAVCPASEHAVHNIAPIWDENSRILILGSFPSVKSREAAFFYAHPQNRFWRVLSDLFGENVPETAEEKRSMLLKNGIALWDVIASCEISGSSDSSIKNAVPNDISEILSKSKISRIFVNGGTAARLYDKYILPKTGIAAVKLPSTSPANASASLEKLTEEWKIIL